ncbi:hypothetical protein J2Z17_000001, partial [Rhizobium halophytocola]|nr:hypothetical protein [Rhizobium halophytocola]
PGISPSRGEIGWRQPLGTRMSDADGVGVEITSIANCDGEPWSCEWGSSQHPTRRKTQWSPRTPLISPLEGEMSRRDRGGCLATKTAASDWRPEAKGARSGNRQRAPLPPSALPGISPSRGEIGWRQRLGRRMSGADGGGVEITSVEKRDESWGSSQHPPRRKTQQPQQAPLISTLEGEMSRSDRGGCLAEMSRTPARRWGDR